MLLFFPNNLIILPMTDPIFWLSCCYGIIKKTSQKLNALFCVVPNMNVVKRRLLMDWIFASQFNYCHLVWMCHHHSVNNKVNCFHEGCLHIVYSDSASSIEVLLYKDRSGSIHNKNVQSLAIETFCLYQ